MSTNSIWIKTQTTTARSSHFIPPAFMVFQYGFSNKLHKQSARMLTLCLAIIYHFHALSLMQTYYILPVLDCAFQFLGNSFWHILSKATGFLHFFSTCIMLKRCSIYDINKQCLSTHSVSFLQLDFPLLRIDFHGSYIFTMASLI